MEAVLCKSALTFLLSQTQSTRNIDAGKKYKPSALSSLEQVKAGGRCGAGTGLYAGSSFGSRQLLAGCKFEGLRKGGIRELSKCSKTEKTRLIKLPWWQSPRQRSARATETSRLVVRAGLSAVPERNLGLYDPGFDKDGCGVGFIAKLSAEPSREIVRLLSSLRLF